MINRNEVNHMEASVDVCLVIRQRLDSPRIETVLRFYICAHPEDARGVERVLRFRKRVREEFDRLVGESERGDGRPEIEFHATRMCGAVRQLFAESTRK